MGFDLPDETSRLYRYVRRLDRRLVKLRRQALSYRPMVAFKWFLTTFALIIPVLALMWFLFHRTHTQYWLLTGPAGSTTAHVASRLQNLLNEPAPIERWLHLNLVPDFALRPSCGALDSIAQLNAGTAHLGFAEDGLPGNFSAMNPCALVPNPGPAMDRSTETGEKVRVVTLLYKSPLHIIARKTLGVKDIQKLAPGTRAYLGPDGSATSFVSQRLIEHYGLRLERQGSSLDFEQAAQGLMEGKFDVAFFLMGLQSNVLHTLMQRSQDFQLLSIETAASVKMLFPYLEPLTIPAAIYPNTPSEILTVGTNTVLLASASLREAEVYEITKKIADHVQDLLHDMPLSFAREIDNDPGKELFYQVHEGAHRFFAQDPPFSLDVRALAGIGTYFSLVYASSAVMLQMLRHYRVHRLLMTVDAILEISQKRGDSTDSMKPIPHLQKARRTALRLMRRRKITCEEFSRIEDYIKAHRL